MMYESNIDNSKSPSIFEIKPIVRFCNYIEVESGSFWGWRIIPDSELILVVEGCFSYQTRNEAFTAQKGDVICIPPLVDHRLTHIPEHGRGVISCIHCDPFDISEPTRDSVFYTLLRPVTEVGDEFAYFESLFSFAARYFGFSGVQNDKLQASIVKTIWLSLLRYWNNESGTKSLSETTVSMINWIRENITKRISRSDIASEFNYSPEHINYLFKKELGVTTSQFINREKVLYGFRLIRQDGLNVKQAADKLGFVDQYHFSKVFKKITGINPSQYKR
ncbi:MAG: AraC family transcriptional regulator [Sedimentisphaeraceae bacterium JB056]